LIVWLLQPVGAAASLRSRRQHGAFVADVTVL